MHTWLHRFVSQFDLDKALTREGRQEITLRYAVWLSIFVLIGLLPFRIIAWFSTKSPANTFYLVNSLAGLALLVFTGWLNERQKHNLASELFIFISCYLSFTVYPFQNPDQVLLYLVIPIAINGLISEGSQSFFILLINLPIFLVLFRIQFADSPFPFFSIIVVIFVAIISWQSSKLIDKMVGQLVSAYHATIEGWATALEMRNQETEGHSQRVVELTMRLAERMAIPANRREHIRRGVLLHDIGKMGIPDTVLCKHGPLTDAELQIMQKHPLYARELLGNIAYLAPALDIPYCHHEKWDGTGYPRGIQGDAIPLEARLFSVVDVWDAMRSQRSYRQAIPESQVFEYLRSEKGRSFDPAVVDEFLDMMHAPPSPGGNSSRLMVIAPLHK